jgi:hypothetical protein
LQELDGILEIRSVQSSAGRTNYPLTVAALPGAELVLQIIYDRNRFDAGAISRMLGHFQTLLEAMAANPDRRLSNLLIVPNGGIEFLGRVDREVEIRGPQVQPDMTKPEPESVYISPRTAVEKTVASIWAQVLGLKQVGVHDDFFEIGGHSLLGTRIISRAREIFQTEVPLRALFENPTVAGLAAEIERLQAEKALPQIAGMVAELEDLSEEEARRLLAQEMSKQR